MHVDVHIPFARREDLDGRLRDAVDALLLVALSLGHGDAVYRRFNENGDELQRTVVLVLVLVLGE